MKKAHARALLAMSILAFVLFTSCKDAAHTCTTNDGCGFSCSYGCVSPAWYADKNETRDCSAGEPCSCVKGTCYTGGKPPEEWAISMEKKG